MANVTLSYKGQIIAELDSRGVKTLQTAGKYCEANIVLDFMNRCPRTELTASMNMVDFFSCFEFSSVAEEVVSEQEEE